MNEMWLVVLGLMDFSPYRAISQTEKEGGRNQQELSKDNEARLMGA